MAESVGSNESGAFKKAIIACDACRKSKTACSGDDECRTCLAKGRLCIYSDNNGRKMVKKSVLHALEARSRKLERLLARMKADLPPDPAARNEDQAEDVNLITYLLARFEVDETSGKLIHVGPGSSTYSALEIRDSLFRDNTRDNTTAFNGDLGVEQPAYNPEVWPIPRSTAVASLQQLPHYEVATQFFQAQHQYIGTIFSFVDPSLFRQRLKQIYENHHKLDFSERDTRLVYCQALLVFAYGQMYSVNMWMSNDGPPGFSFFTRALEFLPDIREEGSVLFVEVLALVGYFYQNLNRRDTAFLYIGHALRMAVALGLHQEVSEATMDDTTREHRRRVWWSVYSMDRILCCKSGNPITISDSDISVSSPSPWPGEENPERSSAVVLAHYTELSRILGRIAKKIYRKNRKSRSGLAVCVQTIMADLAQWLTNLPQYLKLDFERIDNTMTREQVSIYLHYHQCINMTARPLLLGVVTERLKGGLDVEKQANWKKGLSSSTVAVIEEAIKAARNSTTILSAAAERELVATYGFMDGEHAFSAAIVLAMANRAFPTNKRDAEALEKALAVLKWMADRGGSKILKNRYNLLNNLRSSNQRDAETNQVESINQNQPLVDVDVPDNTGSGVSPVVNVMPIPEGGMRPPREYGQEFFDFNSYPYQPTGVDSVEQWLLRESNSIPQMPINFGYMAGTMGNVYAQMGQNGEDVDYGNMVDYNDSWPGIQ